MLPEDTLGPIDPQIRDDPAHAILRAFGSLKKDLVQKGAQELTAYVPLLQKYSLRLLEQCRSAEKLFKKLAYEWLLNYPKQEPDKNRIQDTVDFSSDWDLHKNHIRRIGSDRSKEFSIPIRVVHGKLGESVRNLFYQYTLFFDRTNLYKIYENAHGTNWGCRIRMVGIVSQDPNLEAVSQRR